MPATPLDGRLIPSLCEERTMLAQALFRDANFGGHRLHLVFSCATYVNIPEPRLPNASVQ